MPCHAAIVEKNLTFSPEDSVEKALSVMEENNCRSIPVVGDDGQVVGVFSIRSLLKNLLPVSVAVNDGVQLDLTVKVAPGVAKRLRKVAGLTVGELMERKIAVVHPDTPIWEGVNLIVQYGEPLTVIEQETGKFAGVISERSLLDELNRMQEAEL